MRHALTLPTKFCARVGVATVSWPTPKVGVDVTHLALSCSNGRPPELRPCGRDRSCETTAKSSNGALIRLVNMPHYAPHGIARCIGQGPTNLCTRLDQLAPHQVLRPYIRFAPARRRPASCGVAGESCQLVGSQCFIHVFVLVLEGVINAVVLNSSVACLLGLAALRQC